MRRICYCSFLFFSLQTVNAQVQSTAAPTLWNSFVSVGYADATSSDINDYYNDILNSYRSQGIPILAQTPFGRTAVINAGFLFTRLEDIWFGICVGYWYSPAYANYQDYAGTLRVNGLIKSYEISIKIKNTFMKIGEFPLNVSVVPGIAHASSSITQELRYNNFPNNNYTWKWSASEWGPCFQATLGTSYSFGQLMLSIEGGYRFSFNIATEQTIESSAGNQKMFGPWSIGQWGIVSLLSLETRL